MRRGRVVIAMMRYISDGVLRLLPALAAVCALCGEAAGSDRTGWRWELLPPDTMGALAQARSDQSLRARCRREDSAAPRDSVRLARLVFPEAQPERSACSAPEPEASELWGTDGDVLCTARTPTVLYVAGSFRWLGPNTGALVPLDRRTAAPARVYAKVAGEVRAIASDGSGGWFIGGAFNAVGGSYRHNVAHILHDGEVADWDPHANGADVNAIAVSGRVVYVGGGFTSIGGQDRRFIAALDAGSGRATSWNPWSSGGITSLAVGGNIVFAGGAFDSIAGARRQNLVAIDAATGRATSWRMDAALQVDALLLAGNTLFVGGRFPWIGGHARLHLAAVDIAADTLLSFSPTVVGIYSMYLPTPTVSALALHGNVLYIGGLFTGIGDEARAGLAAIDRSTGLATPWDPGSAGSWTRALAVHADVVYAGGYFDHLGGQPRWGAGAVDRRTGRATPWNPTANGPVEALAIDGGTVYAGGYISSMGPQVRRNGLAALDLRTGAPIAWNPNPVGRTVFTVALSGGTVFAGGDFINIGGQPRAGIAALDTLTGAALDWHPDANGPIETALLKDSLLYVGGEFTAIGAQGRSNLAAVDARTGVVSNWNPACNGAVYSLAAFGNTIWAGGYFARMGGAGPVGSERDNLAAVDATSGQVTAWNPSADSWVNTVVVANGAVYVGGAFNHVGRQDRNGVAAVDLAGGLPTPWDPDADAEVKAVAAMGGRVYVGGYFQHVGRQAREYLAALDPSTGTATTWDPHVDASVWSLVARDQILYAGGVFTSVNGLPHSSLAAIRDPSQLTPDFALGDASPVATTGLSMEAIGPNPAHGSAVVRFSLPSAAITTLSLYDVQGRKVACALNHSPLPAGGHSVAIDLRGLNPGVYLCRLDAGGGWASHKLLVLGR